MAGHFIIPKKYYQFTFVALLILTVFTVLISRVDLGILNTPMALFVAIVKASLVGAFFMGLRWEKSQFNFCWRNCCNDTIFLIYFY